MRLLQIPALNTMVFTLFISLICLATPGDAAPRHDILPGPVFGEVLDVLDGDTITVRMKVWIGQEVQTHVRLAGIDAPEMKGKCEGERRRAAAAKQALQDMLADGKVTLYNIRLEKYAGRVLAQATNTQGIAIAERMIDDGHARPYRGAKRQGWCS